LRDTQGGERRFVGEFIVRAAGVNQPESLRRLAFSAGLDAELHFLDGPAEDVARYTALCRTVEDLVAYVRARARCDARMPW
jgi:hypothetical protein